FQRADALDFPVTRHAGSVPPQPEGKVTKPQAARAIVKTGKIRIRAITPLQLLRPPRTIKD
ncbi:MAG: hypothetical protein ACRELF_04510, partial [Gemmataceae bacterium]